MTLFIKNMVCGRCKTAVKNIAQKVGIEPLNVELGKIIVANTPTDEQSMLLASELELVGFELLDDRRQQVIESIKTTIIEIVHYTEGSERWENLSDTLARHLQKGYGMLSSLFSEVEGMTIEHFNILQKIERVKEFLVYDELTISEIAFQMKYSSVAHLSRQFKKTTGLTPTHFKQMREQKRRSLDEVGHLPK